jgi:DNA polymerase-3 subunit beta
MKFAVQRETILKPLQMVSGIVEKKQTQPILSNILLNLEPNKLTLTATDLEMEVIASIPVETGDTSSTTVPVRKFLDTCKTLNEGSEVKFSVNKEKAVLNSSKTRFSLTTLPAKDFPVIDAKSPLFSFQIPQKSLKHIIDKTSFAMALQDVRYYLNGLLLEINTAYVRAVSTDGHRLAISTADVATGQSEVKSIIVPRKAVLEISRILEDSDEQVEVVIGENYIRLILQDVTFTSKLVDGQYPNYESVIPKNCDKQLVVDKNTIRQCLVRTSILSNEKYRGIKLEINKDYLKASANNPDQEEAEDEIPITYDGEQIEMGFNVNYLIDAITALDSENIELNFTDSNGSTLIQASGEDSCLYVVMPMRL